MLLGLTLQLLCFGHSHNGILHTLVFHRGHVNSPSQWSHVPHIALLDDRRKGSDSQKFSAVIGS